MGNTRSVIQYDSLGNMLQRYDSIKEAQELYNCTHISTVCRGRRAQEKGYYWEYEYPREEDFLPPGTGKRFRQNRKRNRQIRR